MLYLASRFEDGDAIAHAKDWYEHVQAGRIGVSCRPTASLHEAKRPTQTPEQAERHARNHRILMGGAK